MSALVPYGAMAAQQAANNPEAALALAGALASSAYDSARYIARGLSGARAKKRARRESRRAQRVLRNAYPQPLANPQLMLEAPKSSSASIVSRAPQAVAPVAYGSTLRQNYSKLDSYTVKHSEYISEVYGSPGYAVSSYRLNPADILSFPWLSRLVPNYEFYKFKKLTFCLKPQASTFIGGTIMMAVDYDPTDPAPGAKADLLQYDGATRGPSWESVNLIVKPQNSKLLTAQVASSSPPQKRLEDYGYLHVATSGQPGTDVVSELWAEYEIELITPQAAPLCTAFQAQRFGDYSTPMTVADILIDSPSFDVEPGQSCAVQCRSQGTYIVNNFLEGDNWDLTGGAIPYTTYIRVNGNIVPSSTPITYSGGFENNALATTKLTLVPGDVLQFNVENYSGGYVGGVYWRITIIEVNPAALPLMG